MQNISLCSGLRSSHFLLTVILIFVFIVYSPVLRHDFVNWDDDAHLLENPQVRSLQRENIREIFLQTVNQTYIPLTTLSFAVEYHFFGYHPLIYHLDNLLLHILVTALVFIFTRQLGMGLGVAALTTAIFGLHPTHVESVAWVTERKDVLYSTFTMVALCLYLKYIVEGRRLFFWMSFAGAVFSVLAKPMAVSLPFLLILLDWFKKRPLTRRLIWEKMIFFAAVIPVAGMTYLWQARAPDISFGEGLSVWLWCFVFYIKKFFWPQPLFLFYRIPEPIGLGNIEYLLSVLIFAVLVASIYLFRKQRWFIFCIFYYGLSIFFLLRFDLTGDLNKVAERFLYLPSVGFALSVGILVEKIWRWSKGRILWGKSLAVAVAGILVVFSVQTFRQCFVWKDGVALWSHQLKVNPTVATALATHQLARAHAKTKEFAQALENLARFNRGESQAFADEDLRKVNQVLQWLNQAVSIKPDFAKAYFSQGKIYQALGQGEKARELFEKTIFFEPQHTGAYYELGKLYEAKGAVRQARTYYELVLSLTDEAHPLYQQAQEAMGRIEE